MTRGKTGDKRRTEEHRELTVYQEVLSFWFEEVEPKSWWSADPDFDQLIRSSFGATLCRAGQGELSGWRDKPEGRLAEIIVLDQFSRNIHRGSPSAFAQDPMALALAQWACGFYAPIKAEQGERERHSAHHGDEPDAAGCAGAHG